MTDLLQRASQAEAAADGSRTITVTASDDSVDRFGDRILVDGVFAGRKYGAGWQLDNFKKNPVCVLAHSYSTLPIAQVTKIWREAIDRCSRDPATFAIRPAWTEELRKVSEGQQQTLGAYYRPWK